MIPLSVRLSRPDSTRSVLPSTFSSPTAKAENSVPRHKPSCPKKAVGKRNIPNRETIKQVSHVVYALFLRAERASVESRS
jgi:hypothetical protein